MGRLTLLTVSLAMWTTPAVAADRVVRISVFDFRPAALTINSADSVTWRWDGPDTNHSVTAAPGQTERFDSDPDRPLDAINHDAGTTFQHTFRSAGVFVYLCSVHPRFMRATVTVRAVPDHEPPRVRSLRTSLSRGCARRTRDCRQAGARLRFTLSERAILIGEIRRIGGPRSQRSTRLRRFRGRKGRNEIRLAARRFRPGRYIVTLRARDVVGNVSRPARTSFPVGRGSAR